MFDGCLDMDDMSDNSSTIIKGDEGVEVEMGIKL